MSLITEKFEYSTLERVDDEGKRLYKCPDGSHVPSVTRVLSETKDTKGLDAWKKRVGEKKAEEIRNEAALVGTYMHKCIECHILEEEYIKFDPMFSQAKSMADVVIEKGLPDIDEIWGTEVRLYYPGKYAGTTDLVGMYKGNPCIIDFKQTNKPKRKQWITDYYLQLCAYAHAHNKIYNTDIKNGVVLMCSRDYQFQAFELHTDHFYHYSDQWFQRLQMFQEKHK